MSSSSLILAKRKRLQYVVKAQFDLPVQELLNLGSDFSKVESIEQPRWLGNAAIQTLPTSITPDMIMLFPAERGDEGETIDDHWAMTSNWIYYKVKSSTQLDIS
jgi:hypothetical protein